MQKKEYHVTTFRKDLISFGRSAIVDNAFNLSEDVKRRDFTINSLYLDSQGNLIDLLNGKNDINKKYNLPDSPPFEEWLIGGPYCMVDPTSEYSIKNKC